VSQTRYIKSINLGQGQILVVHRLYVTTRGLIRCALITHGMTTSGPTMYDAITQGLTTFGVIVSVRLHVARPDQYHHGQPQCENEQEVYCQDYVAEYQAASVDV